jgi:hypothetical protein
VIDSGGRARRLVLAGALAILAAACGTSASPSPAASIGLASPAPTASSATTSAAPASGAAAASGAASGGPGDIIGALANLNSYKLKFTLASQGASGGLASMGNVGMEGTVVAKPSPASDLRMTMGGIPVPGASAPPSGTAIQVRVVQINGKTYIDLGSGKLVESTSEQLGSMAESLDPQKLLANVSGNLSQMQPVGDEQKDGVATTHYKADPQMLAAAAAGLAKLGLADANWNMDVWVAKDGGYPVAWDMQGTGSNGSQMSITLDISDVNSPSNVVQGP